MVWCNQVQVKETTASTPTLNRRVSLSLLLIDNRQEGKSEGRFSTRSLIKASNVNRSHQIYLCVGNTGFPLKGLCGTSVLCWKPIATLC